MRLLVVANVIPMWDQSAGWFRFFHILRILSQGNQVYFHPLDLRWQARYYGREEVDRYRADIARYGIQVTTGEWGEVSKLLRSSPVEICFFEHYEAARAEIVEEFRFWQPRGMVIVDTVDVAFERLKLKAIVTGKEEDRRHATEVRERELCAYGRADVVVAVSETDAEALRREAMHCRVEVIPLIFPLQPFVKEHCRPRRPTLVFVAHFDHDANVDAIVRFHEDVLPLLVKEIPDVRIQVVGRSPPPEVRALAGPNVEVLGYVPDLGSVYGASDVAIAPMRYGGGLKGKVAEAMSFSLPVVTNSVSLQGFSVRPGREVLIGDDPQSFVDAVLLLLRDPVLYERVREAGWQFVNANYSEEAVGNKLKEVMSRTLNASPRRLPVARRVIRSARAMLERHVLWRLRP